MTVNEDQGVCYKQPTTLEQRVAIASDFVERFDYKIPMSSRAGSTSGFGR